MMRKRWIVLSVAATWVGLALAAASAVWGGEAPASPGKNPPKVGGEVEISSLPFDLNEVIRTVRKNRGLPEEPPKQGFRAEARGERPFVSKGNAFSHETPRFQSEIDANGLRYFHLTPGSSPPISRGKPQGLSAFGGERGADRRGEVADFEILSVRFEQGGVSQTVFGKGRLEKHAPGLLKGEARGGVTSYVRNSGEEGVEMYWVVEEGWNGGTGPAKRGSTIYRDFQPVHTGYNPVPPQSPLQIVFTVRAAGEPEVHPEGLTFPTRDGSGQVAFSNVTVADSAGRLEKIRPSLATGREIVFEVSREFLENAQYPILIDPTVGPEFPVEPSPVYGPALNDQEYPSVASNGTDYFVAWQDRRSIWFYDIYGARVASDGTVLDPAGIAVSTAAWDQEYPSVASNGTDYFVTWQDSRSGAGYDIYGARVTAAGAVLDDPLVGIAVSTAVDWQISASVTSNGTGYFVVWEDYRNWAATKSDIYGARVRASDGLLLDGLPDTGGIAVSTAADDQWYPSVASNGTDYFVVWQDKRSGADYDIYGARVAPDGTVLDPTGIAVSTAANNQMYPSATSNGTDYFVAWMDLRSGTNWDIYGARVAPDGTVLDGPPDIGGIVVSTAASGQYRPSVASNGTDYFVAWQDWRNWAATKYDIYGARVASSDGTVLDAAGILIQQSPYGDFLPAVAYSACGKYLVAYHRFHDDPSFQAQRVMAHLFYAGLQPDADGDDIADACDVCPTIPSNPSGCIPAGGTYPTDINCDVCVDGLDLGVIGRAFGEFCSDPYYNADADVDASGAVDGTDLDALVADFGSGCT